MPDRALAAWGMTLADRIGGGWPEPEVEACDWCDAETPTASDQHLRIIGSNHYWLCDACYRRSLMTPDGRQAPLEAWA